MATTNRLYILLAFVFSTIAVIFALVSLSTEKWIDGKATWVDGSDETNYVNYGLFQGNYIRNLANQRNYQILMTCSFKNNVCAMLCGKDAGARTTLLDNLYNSEINQNYSMDGCSHTTRSMYLYRGFETPMIRADSTTVVPKKNFINAGIWLSTVVFIILGILLGALSAVLALVNTVLNPTQYMFSVGSLYIYNGSAFLFTLLYMILWGTMYNLTMFHNAGIYETLAELINSDKMVFLGYSYWINIIPLVFYIGSMSLLYYREYLNERDPKQQRVNLDSEATEPTLYLY